MAKLLLIDGNSLIFRAYYATSRAAVMSTRDGVPTNAVFGFVSMIRKALSLFSPEEVLVAFDTDKPTFRAQKYPAYKGTRKKPDEELIIQFPIAREYLDAAGMKRYEIAGYEADDIIGTMVERNPGDQIAILTGDKDLLQLTRPWATVYLMRRGITDMVPVRPENLPEVYGVQKPSQVADIKGLMGDSSDNIPGVQHIGEKTARALISQYGTVENLLAHTGELKGKTKEYVEQGRESALFSKELATICTNVPMEISEQELAYRPDPAGEDAFFRKYEMKSLLHGDGAPAEREKAASQVQILEAFDSSRFAGPTALWAAFSARDHKKGELRGYALYDGNSGYFLRAEEAGDSFRAWLKGNTPKIVYDSKELCHLFYTEPESPLGGAFDEMIAAFLVDDRITDYSEFARVYEGPSDAGLEELYGKPSKPKLTDEREEARLACGFARFLHEKEKALRSQLEEKGMTSLYETLEQPLSYVLCRMEKEGIRVDVGMLDVIARQTLAKVEELSAQIYAEAGEEFNLNSPKQLAEVLFDKMKLPDRSKRSTAAEVLEKLRQYPIVQKLLDYRKYQKFYSTYAEGLKKYIHADGKIHTQFNQCLVSTGRLSSSEPNLQNITVRDEESREIRKAFVPEEGCVFMSADYAQIELRMLAHMSGEEKMIETFRKNIDVHARTASDIFHVRPEDVTPEMRRKGKTVNFGIIYGISDYGLAERLGIPREEAAEYIRNYFESYPRVRRYMDDQVAFCEKNGYVRTILGRRREIPEIHAKDYMRREFAKRAAMNAPIQGSAADLIKTAMLRIQGILDERKMRSRMILQVHDELIFNVPVEEMDAMKTIISEGMEHAMELKVPLSAEVVWGKNWYEAE